MPPKKKIPDAWDDDWETLADNIEEEELSKKLEEENEAKKLWEKANSYEAIEILPTNVPPQQATVYKPELKILKRNPNTSASTQSATTSKPAILETREEKERRYREARERIFGKEDPSKGREESSGSGSERKDLQKEKPSLARRIKPKDGGDQESNRGGLVQQAVRAPRGPDASGSGFGGRGRGSRGRGTGRAIVKESAPIV